MGIEGVNQASLTPELLRNLQAKGAMMGSENFTASTRQPMLVKKRSWQQMNLSLRHVRSRVLDRFALRPKIA